MKVSLGDMSLSQSEIKGEFNSGVEWSSLRVTDIFASGMRLDASVYNIENIRLKQQLSKSVWPLVPIGGKDGLARIAYPGRFKRVFTKHSNLPIYRPSQITDIKPKPDLYLSDKTPTNLDALRVKSDQILMTRSGTIGICTLVSKSYDNCIFSDDLLRIEPQESYDSGYLYAFLNSEAGKTIVTTNNYGAVVQHVEPSHLENILVPDPKVEIKIEISDLIHSSFEKRDQANELIDKAEMMLKTELNLPSMSDLTDDLTIDNHSIRSTELDGRFEATFHNTGVKRLIEHLNQNAADLVLLGDTKLSRKIVLPGRFKRIYVEKGQGTVFFGGRQIYELNPNGKKYLSSFLHGNRINEELTLMEDMILVTRSGTVGKVQITPKHWEGWVINEHVIRVIPANNDLSGYIFLWLQSEWGEALIKRFIYGAVVNELDDIQMGMVQVPMLKDGAKMKEINGLVLTANKLRSEAYYDEVNATKTLYEKVIGFPSIE